MRSKEDVQWVCAFQKNDSLLRSDAINYWKKHKVILRDEVLKKRSEELLMMAYDSHGQVIATSTGLKTKVKLLNENWFYQYRCFIDPKNRSLGFDCHLTLESLRVLEEASAKDQDKPIGVIVIVENKNLYDNKLHNAAVWRAYKMYFIGYNSKGQPIRVYYFKGAKI